MATKAKKNTQIEKGLETVKTAVKDINNKAIEVSTEVVEETVATGKEWQALLAKGLKGGTTLFGQQQDIVLTTLESLKGQYTTNNVRLRKLLSFDFDFGFNFGKAEKTVKEAATTAKKKVVAKATTAKATAKKAVKKATATTKTAKKVTAKTAKKAVKATTKTTTTAKKAVKATAKKVTVPTTASKVKATAKKAATTVKAATPKVKAKATVATPTKNNLRVIEGIGPKIEGLLNEAGILTFKQLENAKLTTLAGILDAAGPRFRMHDPATWGAQAAMAAAGKMDELKNWQDELKGGKVAK